jgi:hypothetical protein
MHPAPANNMGLRVVMLTKKFFSGILQLGHPAMLAPQPSKGNSGVESRGNPARSMHRTRPVRFGEFHLLTPRIALAATATGTESYAIWLVHSANAPMLRLCRQSKLATDEAEAGDGYIQFFAERQ